MKNINRLINKIVWCVNIMLFFLVCCKITPIPNPIVFYDNGIINCPYIENENIVDYLTLIPRIPSEIA